MNCSDTRLHRRRRRRFHVSSLPFASSVAAVSVSMRVSAAPLATAASAEIPASGGHLSSLSNLDSLRHVLADLHANGEDNPSFSSSLGKATRRSGNVDVIRRSVLDDVDLFSTNQSASTGGVVDTLPPNRLRSLFGPHDEIALCHIPHLFPANSDDYRDDSAVVALALSHLNEGDGSVVSELDGLPDRCPVRFTYESINTAWKPVRAVEGVIDVTSRDGKTSAYADGRGEDGGRGGGGGGPLACAILGMASSDMTLPSAIVSGIRGYPQVSHEATSSALDNKKQYPLFGRTVPSDDGTAVPVIFYYRRVLSVRHLAVLHVDSSYGNAYAQGLREAAAEYAPDMTVYLIVHSDQRIIDTVKQLKATGCTYFFAVLDGGKKGRNQVLSYMDEAYKQEIAGTGRHNWMFTDSIKKEMSSVEKNTPLGPELRRALQGASIITAVGGIPGIDSYDQLDASARGLTTADAEYLQSKLPIGPITYNEEVFAQSPGIRSPLLYDAVIALGLAACRVAEVSMDDNNGGSGDNGDPSLYFDGEGHFEAMVNGIFSGASGNVAFDNITGTRLPSSTRFLILNYVLDVAVAETAASSRSNNATARLREVQSVLFEDGEWTTIEPFVYNDNTTSIPPDLLPVTVVRNDLTLGLRAGGLTMCFLIVAQSIVFGVWTHVNSESRVVKASQPIFLHVIAFGVLLMGTTIIPISIDQSVASKRGCDIACAAFPWLLFLGFGISFSALFTKTRRINLIFNNPRFKRITVTPRDVIVPMLAILSANVLILGLWTGLNPFQWVVDPVRVDRHNRILETSGMCHSDNPVPYVTLLLVINLGTLLYSIQQAYRARKISTEFSESEYIFKAMTAMLLVSFIGIPVLILAYDNRSASFFVMSAIIFVVCTSLLCLIFVPKMIVHRKQRRERKEKEAKKKAKAAAALHGKGVGGGVGGDDDSHLSGTPNTERLDLSTHSDRHETGIKILDHPMEQEELKKEVQVLRRELAERSVESAPPPPPPPLSSSLAKRSVESAPAAAASMLSSSLSATALRRRTCPNLDGTLRGTSAEESFFAEEYSFRPLIQARVEDEANDCHRDDREARELGEGKRRIQYSWPGTLPGGDMRLGKVEQSMSNKGEVLSASSATASSASS